MPKKIKKDDLQIILGEAPFEKRFFLSDGRTLSTLMDLANVLPTLDDNIFNNHVNKEKNDFYNWVKEVFRDAVLAKAMKKIKNKEELSSLINDHIKALQQK